MSKSIDKETEIINQDISQSLVDEFLDDNAIEALNK